MDGSRICCYHGIQRVGYLSCDLCIYTVCIHCIMVCRDYAVMHCDVTVKLSHLLQKKIHSRSAGRVQSVTLKFIVDREKEIDDFTPEEYWTIEGYFSEQKIKADLVSYKDKPIKLKTEEDVKKAISEFPKDFKIESFSSDKKSKEPRPPFKYLKLQHFNRLALIN